MPSNFDIAFEKLIGLEGGYNNDADDPGGETKYGISKRSYPHVNIATLTKDQAKEIYRKDWWTDKYDQIDPGVAWRLFLFSVNMGENRAVKLLQEALNEMGNALEVDGEWGIKTTAALRKAEPGILVDKLRLQAIGYYIELTDEKERLREFFRGWIKRARL